MQRKKLLCILVVFWLACIAVLVSLLRWPLRSNMLPPAQVTLVALAYALGLAVVWRSKPMRYGYLGIFLVALVCFVMPGQDYNHAALRQNYLDNLRTYEGANFLRGGITRGGIDSAGLVRNCLMESSLKMGLATCNPLLLRQGMSLWWNNCDDQELRAGYGGRAQFLFAAPCMQGLNPNATRYGDIAVTNSGSQAFVYVGNGNWIGSVARMKDSGGVILAQMSSGVGLWYQAKIRIYRWRQFSGVP